MIQVSAQYYYVRVRCLVVRLQVICAAESEIVRDETGTSTMGSGVRCVHLMFPCSHHRSVPSIYKPSPKTEIDTSISS